jgi:hypothetical protein
MSSPDLSAATGWRRPEILLLVMAAAMPLAMSTWQVLFTNFAVERAGLDGAAIGVIQSVREIPGFLAFSFVALLFLFREQTIAILSLLLLGVGVILTGLYPSHAGILTTTLIMSVGFHYFETAQQSLTLQWTEKSKTPQMLGRILSTVSFASLAAFGMVWLLLKFLDLGYMPVYAVGGGLTVAVALFAWLAFPSFPTGPEQKKRLLLRSRYWLYYLLVFMSGARRQIFVVFSVLLLVQKFGLPVETVTLLFLVNYAVNTVAAPWIGRFVARFGERRSLTFEYLGLIGVFVGYAFVDNVWLAGSLYVLDHLFFSMALALKTYFQKIADPGDISPTAGVSFTISHIAAIVIPAAFGILWLTSPAAVFVAGAAMAACSLVMARFVPHDPRPGNETTLARPVGAVAAAE